MNRSFNDCKTAFAKHTAPLFGIVLICIFFAHSTYAQTYSYKPLLSTSDWRVKTAAFEDSSIYWYTKLFETTVDFKTYTAISLCDSLDPLIYIRENTTSKKVYYMNPDDMVEHVLYDFSLKVGDKIFMPLYMSYDIAREFKVTRIDTIIVNGGKRKKFYYQPVSGFGGGFEAIEGIGCLNEPFKIISPVLDPVHYLLCAYSGKTVTYSFHQACNQSPCYNASSLTEIIEPTTRVYPNPCADNLSVSSTEEIPYEIYTSDSKLIRTGTCEGNIHVADLNAGIYIIVLKHEQKNERYVVRKE